MLTTSLCATYTCMCMRACVSEWGWMWGMALGWDYDETELGLSWGREGSMAQARGRRVVAAKGMRQH